MTGPDKRKKPIHVTLDEDLLRDVEVYRRTAIGRPNLSRLIETALEKLLESENSRQLSEKI